MSECLRHIGKTALTRIAVMHDVSSFCNTRLSRGIQLALLLLLQTRAFLRLDCRTMQGGFNTLPQ